MVLEHMLEVTFARTQVENDFEHVDFNLVVLDQSITFNATCELLEYAKLVRVHISWESESASSKVGLDVLGIVTSICLDPLSEASDDNFHSLCCLRGLLSSNFCILYGFLLDCGTLVLDR